jgi:type IV secretory pathway TraG/TraD family ATPase VirD4
MIMEILKMLSVKEWVYIMVLFIINTGVGYSIVKLKERKYIALFSLIFYMLLFIFLQVNVYKLGLYVIVPSFIIGLLLGIFIEETKNDVLWDCEFGTTKGKRFVRNVKRGVLIFGSAGSGKTESPIYALLKHFAKNDFTGIIYDYKDGELSEIAKGLFGERLKVIAIHKPYIGLRINPLDERYIKDEKDINEIVQVIIDNLSGNAKPDFFQENATAVLTAIILKFHLDHREYCTIPHIISFILACDFSQVNTDDEIRLGAEAVETFSKLKSFLLSNKRVQIQASPFLMGLASERQTAAVLSTLANALRKLAYPEAFYVLSGNDVSLDVNDEEVDSVITLLNEPKADSFLTPILACIIHTTTKQMMVRGRKQSFVLLDEAPTIKLRNMAKLPATMRSFGVSVVYCAQDLVQGVVQYGRDAFKEITANLSTQFFGKANDPETAKFYEGYFEIVKEKTKSESFKGGGTSLFSTKNSTNIGEKEVSKVRANEFLRLKVGEFAFLSDGKSEIVQFTKNEIDKPDLDNSRMLTDKMYEDNYFTIISQVEGLLND